MAKGKKATAQLVGLLKVDIDQASLTRVKQQLSAALMDAARNLGGAGIDTKSVTASARAATAVLQQQVAEERLAQAKQRTVQMTERENAALEKLNASAEKQVRAEDRMRDAAEKGAQARINAMEKLYAQAERAARAEDLAAEKSIKAATNTPSSKASINDVLSAAQAKMNDALNYKFLPTQGFLGDLTTAASIAIPVATLFASAFKAAYDQGQEFIRQIQQTSRETGINASQSSALSNFRVFTQDPNSPFANITIAQVQSKLQEVSLLNQGLAQSNPQVENFRNALDQLGLSAVDNSGKVKDVVSFTLELSKALQGLDAGSYARVSTQLGGLFGKDFAAIAGADPKQLEKLATFGVNISDEQLKKANERLVAVQLAAAAEKQFQIAATDALTPIDTQIQSLKQFALLKGSAWLAYFKGDVFNTQRYLDLAAASQDPSKMGEGLAKIFSKPQDEASAQVEFLTGKLDEYQNKIAEIQARNKNNPLNALFNLQDQGDLGKFRGEIAKIIPELEAAKKKKDELFTQQGASDQVAADLSKRVEDYKNALKDLSNQASSGITAEKTRKDANLGALDAFSKQLDAIRRAGDGYDTFYEKLKNTRDAIQELQDLANKPVSFSVLPNGKKLKGTPEDIQDLIDQAEVFRASNLDEGQTLANKLETEARQKATDDARKKPKGDTLTNADKAKIEILQQGGTSNADLVRDQIKERKLSEQAKELGFNDLSEVTTEGIVKQYGKRGLTKDEQKRLADLIQNERKLVLNDRETQFDVVKGGMEKYLEQLANLKGENETTAEAQARFDEAFKSTAGILEDMALKAGLFTSSGFSRAILEAGLQAKLSSGDFGTGAEALKNYADAAKGLYDYLNNNTIQDALTGRTSLTQQQAEDMGLTKAPDMNTDPEGYRASRTATYTGSEVMKLIADKQGIDISNGIKGIFKSTTEEAATLAKDAAEAVDKAFKDVFDNKYKIQFELDDKSLEAAKEALKGLGVVAGQDGFIPPPTFRSPSQPKGTGGFFNLGNSGGITEAPESPTIQYKAEMPQEEKDKVKGEADQVQKDIQDKQDANPTITRAKLEDDAYEKKIAPLIAAAQAAAQQWLNAHPAFLTVTVKYNDPGGPGGKNASGSPDDRDEADDYGGDGGANKNKNKGKGSGVKEAPQKAGGGPVTAGRMYLVGEEGAEYFVPQQNGSIVDARRTLQFMNSVHAQGHGMSTSNSSVYNTTNSFAIDARGASEPAQVVERTVQAAKSLFLSDDPRIVEIERARRYGRR